MGSSSDQSLPLFVRPRPPFAGRCSFLFQRAIQTFSHPLSFLCAWKRVSDFLLGERSLNHCTTALSIAVADMMERLSLAPVGGPPHSSLKKLMLTVSSVR